MRAPHRTYEGWLPVSGWQRPRLMTATDRQPLSRTLAFGVRGRDRDVPSPTSAPARLRCRRCPVPKQYRRRGVSTHTIVRIQLIQLINSTVCRPHPQSARAAVRPAPYCASPATCHLSPFVCRHVPFIHGCYSHKSLTAATDVNLLRLLGLQRLDARLN